MSTPDATGNSLARSIEAMPAVRQHPEWYFRGGRFETREALALLIDEALAHGSDDLLVRELQGWWLLAGSQDWLDGDIAAFFSPVPDPTRGREASRVEVVLTAFCHAVWTASSGALRLVSGRAEPPDEARTVLDSTTWKRVIAFLPPAVSQQSGLTGETQQHLRLVSDDLSSRYDDARARLEDEALAVAAGVVPSMTAGLEPPSLDRALGTEERAAELAELLQADSTLQQLATFVYVAESKWPPDVIARLSRSDVGAESASQFLQRWWLLFKDEVSLVHETRNRLVHQLPVNDGELLRARWLAGYLLRIACADM